MNALWLLQLRNNSSNTNRNATALKHLTLRYGSAKASWRNGKDAPTKSKTGKQPSSNNMTPHHNNNSRKNKLHNRSNSNNSRGGAALSQQINRSQNRANVGGHKKLPQWRRTEAGEEGPAKLAASSNAPNNLQQISSDAQNKKNNAKTEADDGGIEELKKVFFRNLANRPKEVEAGNSNAGFEENTKEKAGWRKPKKMEDSFRRNNNNSRGGNNNNNRYGNRRYNNYNNNSTFHDTYFSNSDKYQSKKNKKKKKRGKKRNGDASSADDEKVVKLPNMPSISVNKLGDLLRIKRSKVNKICADLDLATDSSDDNAMIEMEMANLICEELGFDVEWSDDENMDGTEDYIHEDRPLVISIMGHVDHGKTTLLDALRKRANHALGSVAGSEAGGITQTITAFQLPIENELAEDDGLKKNLLTVLDTPGHAAFSEMRRVCQSASDLVILCVDINQGVADQTKEILNYLKDTECEFIVALTKCDLVNGGERQREVLRNKIESQLVEDDIMTENYGGDVQIVFVSAMTGEGLDNLIGTTDFYKENTTDHKKCATVLNSSSGSGGGKLLSVVCHKEINVGDVFVLESLLTSTKKFGRIRALLPQNIKSAKLTKNDELQSAEPSLPVSILSEVEGAMAGDILRIVKNEDTAREIVEKHEELVTFEEYTVNGGTVDLKDNDVEGTIQVIPLLLKSPTSASLAALEKAVQTLQENNCELFKFRIIQSEVGDVITPKEQMMLKESNGLFLGFDISVPKKLLRNHPNSRQILHNNIIYHLLDEAKSSLAKDYLPHITVQNTTGTAKIQQIFEITSTCDKTKNKIEVKIAGCAVINGRLNQRHLFRVLRKDSSGTAQSEAEVSEKSYKCASLRRVKDIVQVVKSGEECGIQLEDYDGYLVGDVVECYEVLEKEVDLL